MPIIGRNSVGDVKLSPPEGTTATQVSYDAQFQFFSIRGLTPMQDVSTFADEPNTAYEAGEVIIIATMNGLLKSGPGALPIATLWIPPPQRVSATFQYHTSCTVAADGTTGWFNFEDTLATRGVNTNSVIAGTARSNGVTAVAWVTA